MATDQVGQQSGGPGGCGHRWVPEQCVVTAIEAHGHGEPIVRCILGLVSDSPYEVRSSLQVQGESAYALAGSTALRQTRAWPYSTPCSSASRRTSAKRTRPSIRGRVQHRLVMIGRLRELRFVRLWCRLRAPRATSTSCRWSSRTRPTSSTTCHTQSTKRSQSGVPTEVANSSSSTTTWTQRLPYANQAEPLGQQRTSGTCREVLVAPSLSEAPVVNGFRWPALRRPTPGNGRYGAPSGARSRPRRALREKLPSPEPATHTQVRFGARPKRRARA